MSGSPLTAVVADDQPLFRAGLTGALNHLSIFSLVGEAGNGRAALALIREHEPDLAVLGQALDWLCVLGALRRERLGTRVLVLAASFSDEDVRRALDLGAAGVLTKHAEPAELRETLQAIARGERVVDPRLRASSVERDRIVRDDGTKPLTTREEQVLRLMAEGLSGPQMARELVVSPSTIKSHIENLYAKLGVSHRGAAVAEGMRRGLLT